VHLKFIRWVFNFHVSHKKRFTKQKERRIHEPFSKNGTKLNFFWNHPFENVIKTWFHYKEQMHWKSGFTSPVKFAVGVFLVEHFPLAYWWFSLQSVLQPTLFSSFGVPEIGKHRSASIRLRRAWPIARSSFGSIETVHCHNYHITFIDIKIQNIDYLSQSPKEVHIDSCQTNQQNCSRWVFCHCKQKHFRIFGQFPPQGLVMGRIFHCKCCGHKYSLQLPDDKSISAEVQFDCKEMELEELLFQRSIWFHLGMLSVDCQEVSEVPVETRRRL